VGFRLHVPRAVVVEAKLDHYSRALEQASVRLFVADLVYVAFPLEYANRVHERHLGELRELGVGLLGVDGNSREFVSPRLSAHVDQARRAELIEMALLSEVKHG
jgi:hypothetical protein